MKKAIVDIDGVLNYYPQTFIDFMNEVYNFDFKTLKEIKQTIPYETYKKYKAMYRQSEYKNDCQPREGAEQLLKALRANGYLIYIVTARPLFKYNLLENTIIWLNKNNLIYDYIYCSAKKDFTIFEKFGHVDFVIDDNCDNISNIKRINGDDCIYVNIMNIDNMTNECEVDRHTKLVKVLSLINK